MNDIEVGEYVRTNVGVIGKLLRIERDDIDISLKWYVLYIPYKIKGEVYINKPYIVKHSKNIIDLIEKYEFANERLIIDIDRKNNKICLLEPFDDKNLSNSFVVWHDIKDIKSIVTKEQFKQVQYNI